MFVRLEALYKIEIDDHRSVNANEAIRRQSVDEVLHRAAKEVHATTGMKPHVIRRGVDPFYVRSAHKVQVTLPAQENRSVIRGRSIACRTARAPGVGPDSRADAAAARDDCASLRVRQLDAVLRLVTRPRRVA